MLFHAAQLDDHVEGILSGVFRQDLLEEYLTELFHQDWWQPGLHVLWDIRSLNIHHVDTHAIREIGSLTNKFVAQRGMGNCACLVANALGYGLGRMYELMHEMNTNHRFRVFYEKPPAIDWLYSTEPVKNSAD